MELGNKIRTLRKKQNMTQSELAGEHITRNMLSKIENGEALPSLDTLFYSCLRIFSNAPFSKRLTCACEMPISSETSVCVLPL